MPVDNEGCARCFSFVPSMVNARNEIWEKNGFVSDLSFVCDLSFVSDLSFWVGKGVKLE